MADYDLKTTPQLTVEIIDEVDASLVKVPVSFVFLQEVPVGLIKMFLHGIFLHISKYPLAGNLTCCFFLHLWNAGELASRTNRDVFIIAKTEWSTSEFPKKKWPTLWIKHHFKKDISFSPLPDSFQTNLCLLFMIKY